MPLWVHFNHRGSTHYLTCQTSAAFCSPRDAPSQGLGVSQGPHVVTSGNFCVGEPWGGSLKVSQCVISSHGFLLQVAGPVSSSAVTPGTRWSALALWATSCSRMVSPVKVTPEGCSLCLRTPAGGTCGTTLAPLLEGSQDLLASAAHSLGSWTRLSSRRM